MHHRSRARYRFGYEQGTDIVEDGRQLRTQLDECAERCAREFREPDFQVEVRAGDGHVWIVNKRNSRAYGLHPARLSRGPVSVVFDTVRRKLN